MGVLTCPVPSGSPQGCSARRMWRNACNTLCAPDADDAWKQLVDASPPDSLWHSLRNCVAYQAGIWQNLLNKGIDDVIQPAAFKLAIVLRHTPSDLTVKLLSDLLRLHPQSQDLTSYILALLTDDEATWCGGNCSSSSSASPHSSPPSSGTAGSSSGDGTDSRPTPTPPHAQSDHSQSGHSQPDQSQPDQSEPDQSQPDQSEPDQSQPDQSEPDQSQPDQSEPDQSQPDQSEPDQSQPDQSQPEQPPQPQAPQQPQPSTPAGPAPLRDLQLFGDCELAVLAASREEYDAHAKLVRAEYSKLTHDNYVDLRIKVLNQFSQIPKLYHTPEFECFESAARENIEREICTLREHLLTGRKD